MTERYKIKTGYENMDIKSIHSYLSNDSYWAKGIPYSIVDNALNNSFCIGVFDMKKQIAFARLVTDYNTFAYLADVYVLEEYRKQGISKLMMGYIMQLNSVKKIRRFMLATLDAHELYKQYGFTVPKYPDRLMEITKPNIYQK